MLLSMIAPGLYRLSVLAGQGSRMAWQYGSSRRWKGTRAPNQSI